MDTSGAEFAASMRRADSLLAKMTAADFEAEVLALDRYYVALCESVERGERNIENRVGELAPVISETKIVKGFIASVAPIDTAMRRGATGRSATLCLVALRRWLLEHDNAPPPDLAAVCNAAGLEAIPLDDFSGEPMRGAILNGKFVIYSIGPDRKDDQGQIEWDLNNPSSPGDWIFRLE